MCVTSTEAGATVRDEVREAVQTFSWVIDTRYDDCVEAMKEFATEDFVFHLAREGDGNRRRARARGAGPLPVDRAWRGCHLDPQMHGPAAGGALPRRRPRRARQAIQRTLRNIERKANAGSIE